MASRFRPDAAVLTTLAHSAAPLTGSVIAYPMILVLARRSLAMILEVLPGPPARLL